MKNQIYTYNITLNLSSDYFNRFKLKKHFNAQKAEIISGHFKTYDECLKDCHIVVGNFKRLVEKRNKSANFSLGWEINPSRAKEKTLSVATPPTQWANNELAHIFLFSEDAEDLTEALIKASIEVNKSFESEDLH